MTAMTEVRPEILIVSASAGSGKTFRLAKELRRALGAADELPRGGLLVRPEAVLATTFTRKAAAELRERARQALVSAGRVDDAHRLAAARIGTVNAVCGRIVSEFAFELGMSPDVRVLDERGAELALKRAMSRASTEERTDKLEDIQRRFPRSFHLPGWQQHVRQVMNLARANDLKSEDLVAAAVRSAAEIVGFLDPPQDDGLNVRAERALKDFVEDPEVLAIAAKAHGGKGTRDALDLCHEMVRELEGDRTPAWAKWQKVGTTKPAKGALEAHEPVAAVMGEHLGHPQLHKDVTTYIDLVFTIARETLDEYRLQKSQWGVIDFTDQELCCLELLRREHVRRELAASIDLVLVDEFQDTSPIELAIFAKLAEVAPLSIWVGDQKQAIYGFRGTSPDLMDDAVAAIASEGGPESLPNNWRSRPELVALTSHLFAAAFAMHGLEPRLVKLEPARSEPDGLGPVVEWWQWPKDEANKEKDAASLASGVRALLDDPTVHVSDRVDESVRRPQPGDIAVLCRTNAVANMVAEAFAQSGLRAVIPRPGVLSTPEGQLALCGLRLWLDGGDRLALASLARLTAYPADGDEWLAELLKQARDETIGDGGRVGPESGADEERREPAFHDIPAAEAVRSARFARPFAGPAESLDLIMAALDAREVALRWGDADERLANLDAVRALAVRYESEAAQASGGATPAGLATYLLDLADDESDMQATVGGSEAVIVSTWHQAKGLEWPITILYHLEFWRDDPPIGVSVASDHSREFDLADPIAGRWVRFWPNPYWSNTKGVFRERVDAHAETEIYRKRQEFEELRLLYVGWTRARDILILAARQGSILKGILRGLVDSNGPLICQPTDQTVWGTRPVDVTVRDLAPAEPDPLTALASDGYTAAGPRRYAPARLAASSVKGSGRPGEPIRIGDRFRVQGDPLMEHLGNAVHAFMAVDRETDTREERLSAAEALLAGWQVAASVEAEDVVAAADRFAEWVDATWPGAVWHRELPLAVRAPGGTIVSGSADLVLEIGGGVEAAWAAAAEGGEWGATDDGALLGRAFVLIDHKTFPGDDDAAVERAAEYGGQLGAYAAALAGAGGTVVASYIHLPVLGMIVPVEPAGLAPIEVV